MSDGVFEYDPDTGGMYIVIDGDKLGPLDDEQLKQIQEHVNGYFG